MNHPVFNYYNFKLNADFIFNFICRYQVPGTYNAFKWPMITPEKNIKQYNDTQYIILSMCTQHNNGATALEVRK